MTFLAHETLHISSLDPTNGMLCLGCAQKPLEGALGRPWWALGALVGPGGVGSCKVYAPVNPHTKYMRIYGTAREREAKKKLSVAMVESTGRLN